VLTRQVECQIRCMFRALKFHFLLWRHTCWFLHESLHKHEP
jgi:hypothetical protein